MCMMTLVFPMMQEKWRLLAMWNLPYYSAWDSLEKQFHIYFPLPQDKIQECCMTLNNFRFIFRISHKHTALQDVALQGLFHDHSAHYAKPNPKLQSSLPELSLCSSPGSSFPSWPHNQSTRELQACSDPLLDSDKQSKKHCTK